MDDALSIELDTTTLSQKEREIVTYLSGYVVGTFYGRIRFSKHKGIYQQQYLSLLMACKLIEGSETDTSHQKLVDLKNRGSSWKVKSDTVIIFTFTEA